MTIEYVDTPSKHDPPITYEKINERTNHLGYKVVEVYHPSWDGGFYGHALKKRILFFIYKHITSVSIQNDTMFEIISCTRDENRVELIHLARILNDQDIPTRLVKFYGGSIEGSDGKLIHLKPNEIPDELRSSDETQDPNQKVKNKEEILERIARLEGFNKRKDGDFGWRRRNNHQLKGLYWILGKGEDLDKWVYPYQSSEQMQSSEDTAEAKGG